MDVAKNLMEIREEQIRSHYPMAVALLEGFDHAPRIAQARADAVSAAEPASSGIPGRRAFRSTTPGLSTRRTARPAGVSLIQRIEAADDADPLNNLGVASFMQGHLDEARDLFIRARVGGVGMQDEPVCARHKIRLKRQAQRLDRGVKGPPGQHVMLNGKRGAVLGDQRK